MKRLLLFFTIALISSHSVSSQVPQSERNALIAFYNATNGDNWTDNTNWNSANPVSSWYGITTEIVDGIEHVTRMSLTDNNLTGPIPVELTTLNKLVFLGLTGNQLSGEIPNEIGDLSNLSNLFLWSNNLTGSIPQSITNLTLLHRLILGANNLTGIVPDISANTNLLFFDIRDNNFQFADLEPSFTNNEGKLGVGYVFSPQKPINSNYTIDNFSTKFMSIGGSIELTSGTVSGANTVYQWHYNDEPIDIASNPNITDPTQPNLQISNITASQLGFYHCVAYNTLVHRLSFNLGTYLVSIPPNESPDYNALVAIYNSTNGDNWTNNSNWLDNTKPLLLWHGIDNTRDDGIYRVSQLNLDNNNLTGNIPPEIGGLTELTGLRLHANQLTGNIPPEIGNLVNLEFLVLNQNGLTGTIPTTLQNLTKLKGLLIQGSVGEGSEFNNNAFSGDFPDLTALPLEGLWMQSNFFKFTDIADEFATYKANIPDFRFNPQYTTDLPVETNIAIGDDITLTLTDSPLTAKGMTKKTALTANSYQWFKDDVALTVNANTDTYVINNAQASDSGVYHCEITNTDVPDMVIKRQPITLNIGTLSVEETEVNTVKIYPNPTKNILNIKLNNTEILNATLLDISGKQVLNLKLPSEMTVIDISNLKPGIYLLKIDTHKSTVTKRIIKQ